MTVIPEAQELAKEIANLAAGLPEGVELRLHLSLHCKEERDFFIAIDSLGGPSKFKLYDGHAALENAPSPLLVSVHPPYGSFDDQPRFRNRHINRVAEMQKNIEAVEAELGG